MGLVAGQATGCVRVAGLGWPVLNRGSQPSARLLRTVLYGAALQLGRVLSSPEGVTALPVRHGSAGGRRVFRWGESALADDPQGPNCCTLGDLVLRCSYPSTARPQLPPGARLLEVTIDAGSGFGTDLDDRDDDEHPPPEHLLQLGIVCTAASATPPQSPEELPQPPLTSATPSFTPLPQRSFGAVVTGVKLADAPLPDEAIATLLRGLHTHKLLLFRGQVGLTPQAELQFAAQFHGRAEDPGLIDETGGATTARGSIFDVSRHAPTLSPPVSLLHALLYYSCPCCPMHFCSLRKTTYVVLRGPAD